MKIIQLVIYAKYGLVGLGDDGKLYYWNEGLSPKDWTEIV